MSGQHILEVFALTCGISFLDTISQIIFKRVVNQTQIKIQTLRDIFLLAYKMVTNLRVWIGMWIGLATIWLWIAALTRGDINFVYSLSSVHFIFIAYGAKFFLNEPMNSQRLFATVLIALGIAIVSVS